MKPCRRPGCPTLLDDFDRHAYCEAHRDTTPRPSAAKRGYGRRWRRASKRFLREHPLCCDPFGRHPQVRTPATVVDHIIPHRNDDELFWNEDNWQALCDPCHGVKTRLEQRAGGG